MKKTMMMGVVLAGALSAFAGLDNVAITFSTPGPDKYRDGRTVLDGECYALGLDPTKELAKPAAVVKHGGLQSASGVTVHVPNVTAANLPDSGVEVIHRLQRSDDKGANWSDTNVSAGPGESLVVPFESGVLFRVNTVLK